jgi:beta-lactamase class A
MGIFNREPVEEGEVVEEKQGFRPKKLASPDSPDWKKRKKKEMVKPWGKSERYFVLGVILVTVIASAILALSARAWKLPGLPQLKVPSLNIFKSEVIVVEGNKQVNEPNKVRGDKIISDFRKTVNNLSGIYALYVIDLSSGYSFGVNENETMDAASLIKLPVMALTYKLVESEEIKLDETPKGSDRTYRELLRAMGKRSDNTAQLSIVEVLGRPNVQKEASDLGMINTNYENNETSPKDIGEYFRKLWTGKIMNNIDKEEMLSFLTDTIYEDYLKAGVPEEVRVAHKFGIITHVINDAGIVYTDKPYVVVIMTKGIIEKEAKDIFPTLSKLVYEEMISN